MATHSSVLENPRDGRAWWAASMGSHRVRHDWSDLAAAGAEVTILLYWGEHDSPLWYSCLENPMDRGAWWGTVHRVTKSWTWLKWLSMHTCMDAYYYTILYCTILTDLSRKTTASYVFTNTLSLVIFKNPSYWNCILWTLDVILSIMRHQWQIFKQDSNIIWFMFQRYIILVWFY